MIDARLYSRPLVLKPNRVWRPFLGGALLDRWQGVPSAGDGHFPEEWIASVVSSRNPGVSETEGLSFLRESQELSLSQLIRSNPEAALGKEHVRVFGSDPGILSKAIDSATRLMIQVHPDRDFAQRYLGTPHGKTEAWYIVSTREDSEEPPYVYLGFKPGISRKTWKDAMERQDVTLIQSCLHKVPVSPGEAYFIEAGIPHAMGPGVFFMEVMEPTDFTFRPERLSPAGKPLKDEQMHLGIGYEAMLDAFRYDGAAPEADILARTRFRVSGETVLPGVQYRPLLPAEKAQAFMFEEWLVSFPVRVELSGRFSVLCILEGAATMVAGDEEVRVEASDGVFLPAGLESVEIIPDEDCRTIRFLPPAISADSASGVRFYPA